MIKTMLAVLALAVASAAAGQAGAKTLVASPIVKKPSLPKLNIDTHPSIPKICVNELSKGPGAKKCG